MEIILHAHHADVTPSLRTKAETAVRKLGARLRRVVTAIVRFEGDGPTKRVEIVLQAPRRRDLIATAMGRRYEPALAAAVHRLETQVARHKRPHRAPRAAPRTPETYTE